MNHTIQQQKNYNKNSYISFYIFMFLYGIISCETNFCIFDCIICKQQKKKSRYPSVLNLISLPSYIQTVIRVHEPLKKPPFNRTLPRSCGPARTVCCRRVAPRTTGAGFWSSPRCGLRTREPTCALPPWDASSRRKLLFSMQQVLCINQHFFHAWINHSL